MGYRKIKRHSLSVAATLLFADCVSLAGIYFAISEFRRTVGIGGGGAIDLGVIVTLILATVIPLMLIGGYNRLTPMHQVRFVSEHALASVFSFFVGFALIYAVATFGEKTGGAARANVGITQMIFPVLSVMYRHALARRIHAALSGQCLFVVGDGGLAVDFFRMLQARHWPGEVHFFAAQAKRINQPLVADDPNSPILRAGLIPAVSENLDRLMSVVIAADGRELSEGMRQELMALHFRETIVQSFYSFCSTFWKFVPVSQLSLWWVIDEGFRLNRDLTFERFKRFFDIAVSSVALLILAPLFAVVAVLVRMGSPGPAIFCQLRVGLNEETFTVFKFRSMRSGAENGDKYTRKGDSRITPLGAFLRKTRIDELPQLWNVLRGDMSLIGPRAEWVELVKRYEKEIPFYHFRHLVKPGITGWAQVNYPYGENLEDTIEKLKYDLYYVRHYSFTLDMGIVLKTIYTMLGGKGQ
jgi:exopolysaccharide biosynthesis polyprenyl glycosylphosphotransferase